MVQLLQRSRVPVSLKPCATESSTVSIYNRGIPFLLQDRQNRQENIIGQFKDQNTWSS